VHDRHDLTDEEWARLEPLLPDRTPRRGGRWLDHRQVIDGVLWRIRTGCPWRDLPASYGNWKTVYSRHRRWSGDGTWEKILDGLRAGCDLGEGSDWLVGIDGTVVRAHQHAAGARHALPKDIPESVLASSLGSDRADGEAAVPGSSHTGGGVELHESAQRAIPAC
jgi:transposase